MICTSVRGIFAGKHLLIDRATQIHKAENTAGAYNLCGISMLIANTPLYHVTQSSYAFVLVEVDVLNPNPPYSDYTLMVEAAGVEPASENLLT